MLSSRSVIIFAALAACSQFAQAGCLVGSPVEVTGRESFWEGELSILSTTSFKIKDYKVSKDIDLFWYGLPVDGSDSFKIYPTEQTPSGPNDDSGETVTGAVDAMFTVNDGVSLADIKEIQLWCDQFPGAYGVAKYDPAELSIGQNNCTGEVTMSTETPESSSFQAQPTVFVMASLVLPALLVWIG